MNSYLSVRFLVIGICLSVVMCLLGNDVLAAEPFGAGAAEDPEPFTAAADEQDVKKKAARNKKVKELYRKLGMIKPYKSTKKELTDIWVVGTAELNTRTKHVDVLFQAKEGQKESAEFVADFLLRPRSETQWKWQVFCRVKDSYTADEALAAIRKQYDDVVAYREAMMKLYNAQSIRRC